VITHIWLTTHHSNWRSLILRACWDSVDEPAIEVPIGDFFGQGWCEFAQLSSVPVAVNPHGGFNSYWPMPVPRHARLTLENRAPHSATVYYQISYEIDVPRQGYTTYSTPFLGLHQVIRPDGLYRSQQRFGMYRWHLLDPIHFHTDLRVDIQALGWAWAASPQTHPHDPVQSDRPYAHPPTRPGPAAAAALDPAIPNAVIARPVSFRHKTFRYGRQCLNPLQHKKFGDNLPGFPASRVTERYPTPHRLRRRCSGRRSPMF
ncbi:MAG TPA: DUF2961 domain-containing protein, partial [Acetobacteraceae bacterium]|nr:DUF2961 domain-containing protein [Acetobacteraceae bacterium]